MVSPILKMGKLCPEGLINLPEVPQKPRSDPEHLCPMLHASLCSQPVSLLLRVSFSLETREGVMRGFAAGLQLRGLGLGTGHPEWGACRSPRLPVWGRPGQLMCAWAKRSCFVLKWVLLRRECMEGGSGSASRISAGREACGCSGGLWEAPGEGCAALGSSCPGQTPVLTCLCRSVFAHTALQLSQDRPLLTPPTES